MHSTFKKIKHNMRRFETRVNLNVEFNLIFKPNIIWVSQWINNEFVEY